MGAGARTPSRLGCLLIICIGVLATLGYLVQLVGLVQVRKQGVRASLAVAAARGGHNEAVQWLVKRGAQVNATDEEGQSVLSWTVTNGDAEDVRFLVARGADVNRPDDLGRSPLTWAAYRGDTSVVVALLRAGAKVNSPEDITPLGAAIENGNTDTARLLVEHGADPNARHRGWTPLMVCAVFGRSELVLPLHAAGARPDIRDRDGRTALMMARDAKTASVLRSFSTTP